MALGELDGQRRHEVERNVSRGKVLDKRQAEMLGHRRSPACRSQQTHVLEDTFDRLPVTLPLACPGECLGIDPGRLGEMALKRTHGGSSLSGGRRIRRGCACGCRASSVECLRLGHCRIGPAALPGRKAGVCLASQARISLRNASHPGISSKPGCEGRVVSRRGPRGKCRSGFGRPPRRRGAASGRSLPATGRAAAPRRRPRAPRARLRRLRGRCI